MLFLLYSVHLAGNRAWVRENNAALSCKWATTLLWSHTDRNQSPALCLWSRSGFCHFYNLFHVIAYLKEMKFIYWLPLHCLRQVNIRGQSYLLSSLCRLRKSKELCMQVKWGPICAEERYSLQLTCPVRITAPDCFSKKDVTKISIRVFHRHTWAPNIEQGGSCVAQALPLEAAPPFPSIPLQNQGTRTLVSSLLKMNSSLEKWGKIGTLLSVSPYVKIISILICTFPSSPLANTALAHITGWLVLMISFVTSAYTSLGRAETPQKELYFWLRKMQLGGLGS